VDRAGVRAAWPGEPHPTMEDGEPLIPVVLASKSPRRLDLLRLAGLDPVVAPAGIAEDPLPGEPPEELVLRLASEKALAVARDRNRGDLVIGADTLVVLEDRVLGQPRSPSEASAMLRALSGRTHAVHTGVCLLRPGGGEAAGRAESQVTFHPLSDREIEWYVGTGEPMDKAGAYAAQGIGAVFLKEIRGSFHNVVGFPVDLFYHLLPRVGLELKEMVGARGEERGVKSKE
jgi:septum formation protein